MTTTKGLEGVVATESSISSIIDDTLTYVGYDIDDLAENASFEEVVYLLWHKNFQMQAELAELKQQLAENMAVPHEIIESFQNISESTKFIQWLLLRTAVSIWHCMMMKLMYM